MTDWEFKNRPFKHSMPLDYVDKRNGLRVTCLLVAINFDTECLCLWPLPENENIYNNQETEFWVHYSLCEQPLQKLKAIK